MMSLRSAGSNQHPKSSIMADTPESKTMKASTGQLVTGLAGCDLCAIAGDLYSEDLLAENVYDGLLQVPVATTRGAIAVVSNVSAKVNADHRVFIRFLGVLARHDGTEALVESLRSKYSEKGGTLGANAGGNEGGAAAAAVTIETTPTIPQLMLMDIGGSKVRITQEICSNWQYIGQMLDFDDLGNQVATIGTDIRGQENCLIEVLKLWMMGNSRAYQPASWKTFIQLLKDSQFGALAGRLEKTFQ